MKRAVKDRDLALDIPIKVACLCGGSNSSDSESSEKEEETKPPAIPPVPDDPIFSSPTFNPRDRPKTAQFPNEVDIWKCICEIPIPLPLDNEGNFETWQCFYFSIDSGLCETVFAHFFTLHFLHTK